MSECITWVELLKVSGLYTVGIILLTGLSVAAVYVWYWLKERGAG